MELSFYNKKEEFHYEICSKINIQELENKNYDELLELFEIIGLRIINNIDDDDENKNENENEIEILKNQIRNYLNGFNEYSTKLNNIINYNNFTSNIKDLKIKDIEISELLFWKVWKNKILYKKIVSNLSQTHYYGLGKLYYKYDEISDIQWMIDNNLYQLFEYKVKLCENLIFDTLLYDGPLNCIISLYKNGDLKFYQQLFKNYKNQINSIHDLILFSIKSSNINSLQALIELYNNNNKNKKIYDDDDDGDGDGDGDEIIKINNYLKFAIKKLEYGCIKIIVSNFNKDGILSIPLECINFKSRSNLIFKITHYLVENNVISGMENNKEEEREQLFKSLKILISKKKIKILKLKPSELISICFLINKCGKPLLENQIPINEIIINDSMFKNENLYKRLDKIILSNTTTTTTTKDEDDNIIFKIIDFIYQSFNLEPPFNPSDLFNPNDWKDFENPEIIFFFFKYFIKIQKQEQEQKEKCKIDFLNKIIKFINSNKLVTLSQALFYMLVENDDVYLLKMMVSRISCSEFNNCFHSLHLKKVSVQNYIKSISMLDCIYIDYQIQFKINKKREEIFFGFTDYKLFERFLRHSIFYRLDNFHSISIERDFNIIEGIINYNNNSNNSKKNNSEKCPIIKPFVLLQTLLSNYKTKEEFELVFPLLIKTIEITNDPYDPQKLFKSNKQGALKFINWVIINRGDDIKSGRCIIGKNKSLKELFLNDGRFLMDYNKNVEIIGQCGDIELLSEWLSLYFELQPKTQHCFDYDFYKILTDASRFGKLNIFQHLYYFYPNLIVNNQTNNKKLDNQKPFSHNEIKGFNDNQFQPITKLLTPKQIDYINFYNFFKYSLGYNMD
ncbi:hypothetical protein ACTFIW_012381 [Dictyostelium discoideum]